MDTPHKQKWREKLYHIIFGTDTPSGKLFDVVLLVLILISVMAVMLESVASIADKYGRTLLIIEWISTILFTFEYIARIVTSHNPRAYIFSFLGIVDLLSIVPTYLGFMLPGSRSLSVIRAIRLLRVFRVLKLGRYMMAGNLLGNALKASRAKIMVFLFVILAIVSIVGTLMYLIEGPENGFTSIPTSIYWAVVTVTTVGYGDIAPHTVIGQMLATALMITGYAVIAVPTGIVSSELTQQHKKNEEKNSKMCLICDQQNQHQAKYCQHCGEKLV